MLSRKIFVVGGSITPFIGKGSPLFIDKKHPEFQTKKNPDLEYYINTAIQSTLQSTKIPASMVEKAIIGNFASDLFNNQGHLGPLLVAADPAFRFMPAYHVEGACASGGLAYSNAIESILAGNDVVMAVGAEVQTTVSPRVGGDYLARASHYVRQREMDDFTFPALFARRMKAYCIAHGITPADIAPVSVKAYANGNLNPLAHMHTAKMTLEKASSASDSNPNFLQNPDFKEWLKVSDCSQVSDGGAALILCSSDGLRKLGKNPSDCVEIVSYAVAADNLTVDGDLLRMETSQHAIQKALKRANVNPKQINVAEVHDCFNIAEVLQYEAIGWAEQGKGHLLAKEGVTNIDGAHPVNTGGGLISFGHPVGATGVKQVLEVFNQMKGKCGDYQIKNPVNIGLTSNMGGDDKTSVASVLKNIQ